MEFLEEVPVILGDGAMGTMLQRSGLAQGEAPELWNVDHPERVLAVHCAYIDAGSQLIETNTFGGNRARLARHGLQGRAAEFNEAGARLARKAVGDSGVLVAGSIGPLGEFIEPLGTLTRAEASEMFRLQAEALVAGGVDFFLIETMSDLSEVEAAVSGVRAASGLPVAVTMTFDTNLHTMMGVSPSDAVTAITGLGICLVGANCGNGPDEMERVAAEMAEVSPPGTYLIAQSNAGLPQLRDGQIHYDATPQAMADHALRLLDLGVRVIGACCGSTPEHIKAMRDALMLRTRPRPGNPRGF
jgi:5-methyltetrahydrofolate--homocysteine methyltransferase